MRNSDSLSSYPCATVEGLLLLKLYTLPGLYRQGDGTRIGLYEYDAFTLLYTFSPDIEPLVNELANYVGSSDLRQIRNILSELQERIDRINRRGYALQRPPEG